MENIIHPIVRKKKREFIKKNQFSLIIALDVPLLYETGSNKECDHIFLVNARKIIQKKRVLKRKNMTEKKFKLINEAQWTYEKKLSKKPYLISTSYGKFISFIIVLFYLLKIIIIHKVKKH